MNITESSSWNLFFYFSLTIIGLLLIWYVYKQVALRSYRERILNYRNDILNYNIPDNTFMLVKYGSDTDKKVGFIKCKIIHVYKNIDKVNVIFKSGPKSYDKSISKDVDIKLIYPDWAISLKDIQNG